MKRKLSFQKSEIIKEQSKEEPPKKKFKVDFRTQIKLYNQNEYTNSEKKNKTSFNFGTV